MVGSVSFSGLASGIDGDALIKAMIDSRSVGKIPYENKIQANKDQNSSLEELNTKLLGLRGIMDAFLTLRGGGMQKLATSSDSSVATISAIPGAPNTVTEMEIIQLAKSATFSFADRFSSISSEVAPGLEQESLLSFTFGTGSKAKTIDVTVKPGMKLEDLVDAINAKAENYGRASLVNAGTESSPEYVLYFNGNKTGTAEGQITVNVGAELLAENVFTGTFLDQSRDSIIQVQGLGEIRRSSNIVADVIPGATIELKKTTTGSVNLAVRADAEKTADKVQEMLDLFNEMIVFSKDKSQIERVEDQGKVSNSFGPLARTRVDEQVLSQLRGAMNGMLSGGEGGVVRIFADLGITTQRDGTLAFNRQQFLSSIDKDPNGVTGLLSQFADKVARTDGIIAKYTQFQGIIDSAVQSNEETNDSLQSKLERMQRSIDAQAATMRMTFARLESSTSSMQQAGSAISMMMSSLSVNR